MTAGYTTTAVSTTAEELTFCRFVDEEIPTCLPRLIDGPAGADAAVVMEEEVRTTTAAPAVDVGRPKPKLTSTAFKRISNPEEV